MSSGINIRIDGDKALMGRLDALKRGARNKILRPAISAAVRPVRQAAKANVPKRSGLLKKTIDAKIKSGEDTVFGVVGPRSNPRDSQLYVEKGRKKARRIVPLYYAHLVESGARPHAIGRGSRLQRGTRRSARTGKIIAVARKMVQTGGMHPGMAGTHFMQRAWQSTAQQARSTIERKVAEGLEKHA